MLKHFCHLNKNFSETLKIILLIEGGFPVPGPWCVLEAGKEVVFNPDDDDFEHQLDLRMACVDPSTKDELHMVEVEGQDTEGQKIKAALVSLKPSTLPSVCLGGFTITPPAVFRLKAGSGPIHLSGQHLVSEYLTRECQGEVYSRKVLSQDDEEDDEDEESEEEEESPVKAKPTPSKKTAAAQNGKSPKSNTPPTKQEKTPKGKGDKSPKTPPTPKANLTLPEIKAKMMEAVKKGVTLPKIQPKFENFLKHGYKVSDAKVIAELWKWRQTVKDAK
uniref:Nucleophosmin 1a n=1 Tax=Lates calcarifer TaxID=8187 RepID=A0A4W6F4G7_LATCA